MFHLRNLAGLICALLVYQAMESAAVTPPVVRSTSYNGAYSNIVYYPVQPWMNTNTVLMTLEMWVYCNDLDGFQALVSRHYATNLWFGLNGNHLRFYRSGGTLADSDGTLVVGRWTHVAVTYDGATARFYIDGVSAGVKALANAGNNCTNSLSLGGQHDVLNLGDIFAGGHAFNGYLDEVRLWSVVRSQSAIAANMNTELRSGTGLLATFGTGGNFDDVHAASGLTDGIPAANRWSGFGILPSGLCIPHVGNALTLDANIDLLNEYRGAETLVLRSTTSTTTRDQVAYLMVSTNGSNQYLYVGVPDMPQAGTPYIPYVEIRCDVNVADAWPGLGDWQCSVAQDTFQGGSIYTTNPPLFPTPQWWGWGQGTTSWQGMTAVSFEFHQSYEFRINSRNLNYFTNAVGLMVRYLDFEGTGDILAGPRGAVTNLPSTYARADWCGQADTDLATVSLSGSVTNVSDHAGKAGLNVSLYSGDSELSGFLLATTTTDAQGKFYFSYVLAPMERRLAIAYGPPANIVYLDPAIDTNFSSRVPVSTNSPFSVSYLPCPSVCSYAKVNFRYRALGPVQITGVNPTTVPASVVVRTSPLKTTAGSTITVAGTNFFPGVQVYFRGSGCALIPPSLCPDDFVEAPILSQTEDGLSMEVQVPTNLTGVATSTRIFQIVIRNPTGGGSFIYGPNVTVTPPTYPQLYGFEFKNMDDHPSEEEFEACYGDSIFITIPFTDIPIPGLRDPYYGLFFLVYMGWMEAAQGSCSGFAATSRLMADGDIPVAAFDNVGSGDGYHGVLYPDGYVGQPPCEAGDDRLCAPRPGRWTGFDLFQPFRPLNVWGRIISLQGAQTSAEFLNGWLGQLHRPIAFGPRRGISVGDPNLVLNQIRTNPRDYLVTLGGREFQSLHTVTPYGVIEEQGLADDLLTAVPRAGFSLIKVYDSNWPARERYMEIDRTQNTFRYLMGYRTDGSTNVVDGAGLYYTPMSVFRGRRHALGPFDIAANLDRLLRVLMTGTEVASIEDNAGGTAGWTSTNLVNTYDGALPFVPPAFVFNQPDRFDRTMFFLPDTNAPTHAWFQSSGSNVFLHYALGGGDFAFGFNAANTTASNSVDGILIGLNQGLLAMGLTLGAPVTDFGAMVASRDTMGQSRVFLIEADPGAFTPDVLIERDGFTSLTIHNRSAAKFPFRLGLSGIDNRIGAFDHAYALYSLPGKATLKILLPDNPANPALTRQLDLGSDGTVDSVEEVPANGQLRVGKEPGMLALRWRTTGFGEVLESTTALASNTWSTVGLPVTTEGQDQVVRFAPGKSAEFFRLRLPATNCLSLSAQPIGALPNPWLAEGFKFESRSSVGDLLPQNSIVSRYGYAGLDVVNTMLVTPLDDCGVIHLDVSQKSGLVTFEAVGPLGVVVDRQTVNDFGPSPEQVTLRAFRGHIAYVRVVSPNGQCLILNVCGERVQPPVNQLLSTCLDLSGAKAGQYTSPYAINGLTLSAKPDPVILQTLNGLTGTWLKLAGEVQIVLPQNNTACLQLRLLLRDEEGAVTVTAYNANNEVVATAGPPPAGSTPQQLVLSGTGIVRLVISSKSDKSFLQEICCDMAPSP
jgi:hypothetical protein